MVGLGPARDDRLIGGTRRAQGVTVPAGGCQGRRPIALALALWTVVFAACSSSLPTPATPGAPSEEPQQTVGALGASVGRPSPLRSVSVVGAGVVASGDFRGSGKSQIALLADPSKDQSLRISVRDANADGETFSESVWLTTGPGFFALPRARFAVADVTFDGRDDLVALYNDGEDRVRLLVFRSTGSAFMPPEAWWSSQDYTWSRARAVLAGNFSPANDRDGVLVAYQYDNSQLRIHSFASTGSSFTFGGAQGIYDSGPGQFDTARARFAVGRFTRPAGPQQIAILYQYPGARVRLHLFEPTATGLVVTSNLYESNEGEYDLSRATIAAADVTGDGKDDLLSLYGDADGSARVQVFDAAGSFRPVNGWASLPASSVCAGASALLVGDWDGDGKADADAIAPGDGTEVRSNLLRNTGGTFKVTSTAEETLCARWPLTGLPLNGGQATRRPLYVKIDNNSHARPHYGISRADQVYEWLVEGLTTRLAAVFQSQEPGVIGSVRSARITDAPIVPSLGGAFVYSGGGPEELMRLNYDAAVAHRYVDLGPGYGWGYRVPFREAPYNYFTTYRALREALAAAPAGDQPVDVPPWDFLPASNTEPLAGGFGGSAEATSITIPYRPGFAVRYQYDGASRTYARYQDGMREIDGANGEVIAARDIVVIQTEVHFTDQFGLDPAGNPKLDMALTGTGHSIVFRDGRRQEVTWTRPDIFDVFLLRNATGELVRLSPGQTWIHIVPKDWTIPSQ